MVAPISGGCLCGQVRYVCSEPPVWSANCHCRSCQKLSGAPYVSAFSVAADSFTATGDTVEFRRSSDAGHIVTSSHCANCGAKVHAQSAGARHLMNVFAATLDDAAGFQPISNVYLSEAAPWLSPPDAPYNFDRMPHR